MPSEPTARPAFARAADAQAALRAQREAALTPAQRQLYEAMKAEGASALDAATQQAEASREDRVTALTQGRLSGQNTPELRMGNALRPSYEQARRWAEGEIRRIETNERQAREKALRQRLDAFLADCARARDERDRDR